MKIYLFQSCGHCWVFQICWHSECSTVTASSFRFLNSSAGIPTPPLTLLVVMLPKAHLTSHSKMSDSGWVITSLWLPGSWTSFFVQFFCVFLPPLLSISASVPSCVHLCMKCSLGISELEEISSLSHSIFLYFFVLITEGGFLTSPCYSLELCILVGISFPLT